MDSSEFFPQSPSPRVYTVSSLTEKIKSLLEDHFEFVWVEGEISNFRMPASGHYYFVLKDDKAQIRAVMFRPQARYLKFMPDDGMKVIAQGRLGVYEPRGEYQIVLDYLEPLGVGALALAFEQLKKKLAGEGLFDQSLKRPLPFLPQRVAVITSPTGAAIRDFLKIIHRRFANIEIIIVPVKVQGEGASEEMVEALETINREIQADVIVLTRGGGSLEDLWAFNNEKLARAIRSSRIPVVSAVGHEIDVTISDLAADLRAPTPSAAAELLVMEKESLIERLREFKARLGQAERSYIHSLHQRFMLLSRGLRDPRRRIGDAWIRLDELHGRIIQLVSRIIRERRRGLAYEVRTLIVHSPSNKAASYGKILEFQAHTLTLLMNRRFREYQMQVSILKERLKDLGPLSVLKRGYSITWRLPEREILRSAEGVLRGDRVDVLLAQGEMRCRVEDIRKQEERG